MNTLDNVAVGDKIYVFGRYSVVTTAVRKVNKLDIECENNVRYLKRNGSVRGDSVWGTTFAMPDSEAARERAEAIRLTNRQIALRNRVKGLPLPPLRRAMSEADIDTLEKWLDLYPFKDRNPESP